MHMCSVVVAALAALSSLASASDAPASHGASERARLRIGSAPGLWHVVDLTHGDLAGLAPVDGVWRLDLPLPGNERVLSLDLTPTSVLAPGAGVVVDGIDGPRPIAMPDLVVLAGTVQGHPESRAFVGSSPFGTQGYVQHEGRTWMISTGPSDGGLAGPVVVAAFDGDLAAWLGVADFECLVLDPGVEPAPVASPASGSTDFVCRLSQVALETDYEFTSALFGGNPQAAAAYAAILTAAVSEVYRRDLNLGLQITYLRLWEDPNDPWTQTSTGNQLTQFRSYWNSNMGFVQRDAAHFYSGRALGGGVAWLSSVCNSFAYALSANLGGSFPYPIQNNNGGNWDLMVVAHEWGHNFGAQHTHDLNPPPDLCGASNCAGANLGTIMSYCHTCSGGMANMVMAFHPQSQAQMDAYLATTGTCVLPPAATIALGESGVTAAGTSLDFDVLANEIGVNCDAVSLLSFDATSALGGSVQRLIGVGPNGRDLLRYTPPATGSGTDTVGYQVQAVGLSPSSTTIQIALLPLREPVAPAVVSGLNVGYYVLAAPSVLPDFGALSPYQNDVVPRINYPSTNGNFATSGRADEVGAVFTGLLTVPTDGLYTLFIESDDGSRLKIGSDIIVSNDGLHGMLERSGPVAFKAGAHPITVEFFENGGGAGLIARIQGPGVPKQAIPAAMFGRPNPCPPDLTATAVVGQPGYGTPDGNLSSEDFFYFLAQYSTGNLAVCDFTHTAVPGTPGYGQPNGVVNSEDFFYYITLYVNGCTF